MHSRRVYSLATAAMVRSGSNPPPAARDADAASNRAAVSTPSASQVAHELNNLLDGSLRSVGLALRRLRDSPLNDEQQDAVDKLESADRLLQRMIGLVDTLGNTDASDSATPSAANRTLGAALEHALESCAAVAESEGISVAAVADPTLAPLPADALFTVMSNALKNAIESIQARRARDGDPHGLDRVELRLERDDDDVVLRVTDSGAGIDRALLGPGGGFRFGVTTKPDGHGIGLGLCHQIAQSLGGRLWLRNQTPRGAVLTLRFPASALRG